MTRVLFDLSVLSTRTRFTGIGRYIAELARSLEEQAALAPDLEIVGLERLAWARPAQTTTSLAQAVSELTSSSDIAHYWRWTYPIRASLARSARHARADVLHSGHPNATPIGRLPCPRIVTCHDLIPLRFPKHYLSIQDGYLAGRRRLDARRYHSAEHIIAVSETTAHDLVNMLDVSADRITVVYNGVDVERWARADFDAEQTVARHGLHAGRYLIYAGAADWRKNTDGMLKALALARGRAGCSDLELAWAGNLREPERTRIAALAESLGLERHVRYLGFVPDGELAALYRAALAQLFVSRAEGFGYPLIEAMAAGCPAIASNCSSLGEIAGDAALKVDPEHPEAIADAIVTLATTERERERLREAGRRRAGQFSLTRCASETMAVYRQVAERARKLTLSPPA